MLATIGTFCTATASQDVLDKLPFTNTVPYCFLLAAMGLSFTGFVIGSSVVFVVHRIELEWFLEVCPFSHPLSRSLDANEGTGYDGDKGSHLPHGALPLSPLLHDRKFHMDLCSR